MDNTETVYLYYDVTPELKEIIEKQDKTIEELQYQTEVMKVQIDGISQVLDWQYATVGIIVIVLVARAIWRVLSGWYFRGC